MNEARIEIRWRDMDAYGHVNNAVFLNYLEECRDALVQKALGAISDTDNFILVRVAIDYRNELKLDDGAVIVRCRLAQIGRSSVTTREEILKLDGTVSAESESVIVPRVPETGRSRRLRDDEREALEAELTADDSGSLRQTT